MNTCHHHPPAPPKKAQFLVDNLLGLGLLGGGTTLSETVLESSVDVLEVSHSAGTGGLSPLGLKTPVEGPQLGGRVTTLSAGKLLLVERPVTTSPAEGVGLGVSFTKGGSTFTHFDSLDRKSVV